MMKKIAVANQKGGCGKTTTTINLAGALADAGKRTLIIDLDPQAHASFGLNASSQSMDRSIYNVLTDNPDKNRPINDCIVKVAQNIDIVPANILLSTLEQELKDKEDAVSKLNLALAMGQLEYDYVLVDCPPSLGFLTFNALRAADHVIVPIDMSAFSLMGVGKLLGMIELIKIKINHAPRVSALATLYDKRTKYSQVIYDEIKTFFKAQMLTAIIRMSVDLKKAAAKGVCVTQLNKDSIGAKDYTALGQEILRLDGAEEFEKALNDTAPMTVTISTPTAENAPTERVDVVALPQALETAIRESAPSTHHQAINSPRNVIIDEPVAPAQEASSGFKEILFNIDAPNAKEIHIVGDFNNWQPGENSRLSRLEGGRWEKKLGLNPGRHKYKFVIDGEWVSDSNNKEQEQNSFGTFDSVIIL
ncbi:MAG: AAA family ATPase [Candidatus Omnitrophica bacterium]|nr:AAA family ATPase [Candidatus Omnitrophota bacterium]